MTDCPSCTAAMANPSLNEFTNGCRSCSARALAAIRIDLLPEADRVAALEKVAPGDAEFRGVVREWVKRIVKHRSMNARGS